MMDDWIPWAMFAFGAAFGSVLAAAALMLIWFDEDRE